MDGLAVKKNCVSSLETETAGLPETFQSALFAYAPDRLATVDAERLTALFNENDLFKRMIIDMRRNRKFLAPQYGL